ncbi:hypothetical protein BHE74_00014869 [Ensete ventricosum]|nr:hypothetical protein GW17_00028471 [Ensete ventricosum]RWW77000.1 hypothetical protein BHE74_00014869 [Ensete ventricosum]RZS16679.1 hypothetical protein BHM03_00048712 [Ensete ventricosum]
MLILGGFLLGIGICFTNQARLYVMLCYLCWWRQRCQASTVLCWFTYERTE